MNEHTLVLVSIGNSRARVAVARSVGGGFGPKSLDPSRVVENGASGAFEDALASAVGDRREGVRVLLASVNEAMVPRVESAASRLGVPVTRLVSGGERVNTLRVPVTADVREPGRVGVDRLLNALAATSRSGGSSCAVIDAGTCVTVDYVDAHGVFHGGVISPGVSLMLKAMHEGTSALPTVESPRKREEVPAGPWGQSTNEAMVLGALGAVRGLLRHQVDAYAEKAGVYPRVIATGGDAPILFEHDEVVEHIVPDLPLMGMLEAWRVGNQ